MKAAKGFKSIYFIGANLNSGQREVYSHRTTPRMKVADGLRISMSFPFAFVAKNNTGRSVHRRRHDRQLPGAAVRL